MIRLIRFMSANEALKFVTGEKLHNGADHRSNGNASDSFGFCFAIADDSIHDRESIYNAAKYLSGIVTMDVCMMARVTTPKRERLFTESEARYSAGMVKELCTDEYSSDSFDDWKLYTPEIPVGAFKMIASHCWVHPMESLTKVGLKI